MTLTKISRACHYSTYLRNGTVQHHGVICKKSTTQIYIYNEILIGIYTRLTQRCNFERPRATARSSFNDTHRALCGLSLTAELVPVAFLRLCRSTLCLVFRTRTDGDRVTCPSKDVRNWAGHLTVTFTNQYTLHNFTLNSRVLQCKQAVTWQRLLTSCS